ncbi:MAG: hypothetical protein GTN76_15040 [Candidatus Aenigmarchaeota archaeon]|nr:hypothetical protein [Candidatus Aenigmarchaeota archaeon]
MRRFSDNRGLSVLVGIAVLAFIILNGWYTFFAYLSRFWIFLLVVIGFILMWFYHKEKGPAETGKGRAVSMPFDGIGRKAAERLWKKVAGVEKDLEDVVLRAIEAVEGSSNSVEFSENRGAAEIALAEYRRAIELAGIKGPANKYNEFKKMLNEAIKKKGKKFDVKKVG